MGIESGQAHGRLQGLYRLPPESLFAPLRKIQCGRAVPLPIRNIPYRNAVCRDVVGGNVNVEIPL